MVGVNGANDTVLITWIFGQHLYASVSFLLFLRSAAGSGVDLVLLGTKPPPEMLLPTNVRHVSVEWNHVVSKLERAYNQSFNHLRTSDYYKACDLRVFTALVFPELVVGYTFWGWCDSDLLLGDMAAVMEMARVGEAADIFVPPSRYNEKKFSFGPLSVFRNTPVILSLLTSQKNRRIIERTLGSNEFTCFDEWGECGGGPYTASFSGLLDAAVASRILRIKILPSLTSEWDRKCKVAKSGELLTRCDVCVAYFSEEGKTTLLGSNGKPQPFCHFQYGKHTHVFNKSLNIAPWKLLQSSAVTYSWSTGFLPLCSHNWLDYSHP